jgi:hypothetical protein
MNLLRGSKLFGGCQRATITIARRYNALAGIEIIMVNGLWPILIPGLALAVDGPATGGIFSFPGVRLP